MDKACRLPRNVEALTRIVRERDLTIKAQDVTLKAKDFEIEHLRLRVARLRRLKFGQSSERFIGDVEQLALLGEAKVALPSSSAMAVVGDEPAPARKQPLREALPEHLPREFVKLPSPCGCSSCGGKLRRIGTVTSEILEIVPTQLKVKRHLRDKFSCVACDTVVAAPPPVKPIAGSYVGSSLLAFVVSSKYCYHMPYYRLAQMLTRLGYPIDRSVLTQWAKAGYEIRAPLINALGEYVLSAGKLHADDTPFKVLSPGSGSTKKGRLWAYVRDERPWESGAPPAAWYQYSPTWEGKYPQAHLRSFKGTLQADGYKGYGALYEPRAPGEDPKVYESGCWAHRHSSHQPNPGAVAMARRPSTSARAGSQGSLKNPPPSGPWGALQALMDDGGQVTLGAIGPIRGAATASMPAGMLAGLTRKDGERWEWCA